MWEERVRINDSCLRSCASWGSRFQSMLCPRRGTSLWATCAVTMRRSGERRGVVDESVWDGLWLCKLSAFFSPASLLRKLPRRSSETSLPRSRCPPRLPSVSWHGPSTRRWHFMHSESPAFLQEVARGRKNSLGPANLMRTCCGGLVVRRRCHRAVPCHALCCMRFYA